MGFCITNRNARHWAAGSVPKRFRALKERKEILPLALAHSGSSFVGGRRGSHLGNVAVSQYPHHTFASAYRCCFSAGLTSCFRFIHFN